MLAPVANRLRLDLRLRTYRRAAGCFSNALENVAGGRAGLAAAQAERVPTGPRTIEVARVRITEAERRVLRGAKP